MSRALVKNAADPEQVKRAERKQQQATVNYQLALMDMLATAAGRIVFWELLSRAGVFRSIYTEGEFIRYLAGRQDFGHELMADLIEADREKYELMEREARSRDRRNDLETEAAQTDSATH